MRGIILLLLVAVASAGCSTTTGVVKISDDTYMLSVVS